MTDEPSAEPAAIGGDVVWDADTLIEALRRRMAGIGASYSCIEQLANMGEGSLRKYLSDARVRQLTVNSLLRLATVLGLRVELYADEKLTRRVQAMWSKRDGSRVHARRLPSLGRATLKRILKPAAAELGRRGGRARMAAMTPEQRRLMGQLGAADRWGRRTSATSRHDY
jgi:hypothetical protein